MAIKLSASQHIFLNELNTKFRAYVGGFGSGKTFVGCLDLLIFHARHPGTTTGYFGPTYPAITDIFCPTMEEAAGMLGFAATWKESKKEVHISRGGKLYGVVKCRSMDNPKSIVGFKIARAMCDEIDTLPAEKAKNAWRKIIARMRLTIVGVENVVCVTTTPEGFGFVYEQFAKKPTSSYSMVQASTYENEEFLPPDYIPSLIESYPSQLIEAYLNGLFVNLTSGAVYHQFSRQLNHSGERWDGREALHIGMDFNVGHMAAVVYVIRDGDPVAVDEIIDAYDTPDIIGKIQRRYWDNGRKCSIAVYPDASGNARKSVGASVTDHALLRQAGFTVIVDGANPSIRDRVNSMNTMICNAKGERRYKINTHQCPQTTACLEQQAYDKHGEPDKSSGKDHPADAAGYPICKLFPIRKPVAHIPVAFAL